MNLRERFKRLTLWNKVNVLGAVAGIFSVLLTVVIYFLSQADSASFARIDELNAIATPPGYEVINRPYLDASLVIHTLSDAEMAYHFEITNLGKLPAHSIRLVYRTPISCGYESGGTSPPDLAPGATMSLDHITFRSDLGPTDATLAIIAACDYSGVLGAVTNHYHSEFTFLIYTKDVRLGVYRHSRATLKSGLLSAPQRMEVMERERFLESPTFGTCFWFDLRQQPDKMPVAFLHTQRRTLLYEPFTSNVIFRATLPSGEIRLLAQRLGRPGKHWHFVAVQATTNQAMLMVDGAGAWPEQENILDEMRKE